MVSGERRSNTVAPAQEHSAQLLNVVVSVATPAMRTYVVQPHDTLWSIASSQLGSPLRWPRRPGQIRSPATRRQGAHRRTLD